ncbi:MAG TPA: PAS domain-containing sensor histidine kinase [Actinomycetota bacterium]|nr:PAS domain-containing sensor histidine kinase [Actinomycetota bacterium]
MDYRTLVEQIPAITYVEVHGTPAGSQRTTYVSPQAATILGHGPSEFVQDAELWRKLRHPADRATVLAAERTAEVTRQPFHAVYRMYDRSGRLHWFRDDAVIVDHEGGTFWQGVMFDITTQKETETELQEAVDRERGLAERLRELDELKNTLLHTLSHDLRDPLTAVLGAASTLRRSDLGPARTSELLDGLTSGARKMDRLLTDLLDLERLSHGVVEPNLADVDIGSLVETVVREMEHDGWTIEVDAEPVVVSADAPKVERIVENLLVNATRHTPSGSHVWVLVRAEDDGVLIRVDDDGPGVAEEVKPVVFEPFRKADADSPGSGIGLSLVARFAELHGGRAWVRDRVGGGASFRVVLPGPRRS